MKLAEALQERADIQKRIGQLKIRLRNNARVQEGEKPSEDPESLLKELNSLTQRLEELITRINITNATTKDGSETLTALLARRDCLQTKIAIFRDFLDVANDLSSRALRTEIRILSTVPIAEKRKVLDKLCQEFRMLDTRIQQKNWLTDLA